MTILVFLGILGYGTGMGAVYALWNPVSYDEKFGTGFATLAWPVLLPATLTVLAVRHAVDLFRRRSERLESARLKAKAEAEAVDRELFG